jgi:hypothetical protein
MVCDIRLTNVTRREEPAAPEGGGSEAAGAEEAEEAGVADGILASVGVAERPLGDGVRVAAVPVVGDFAAVAPPPAVGAAAVEGRCPPAATTVPAPFAPRAAQPAVSVMVPSNTAAVVSASDNHVRRRLPFRPNITSILPACIGSCTGDARRRRQITHFGFRIFRYRGLRVVSPRL